MIREKKTPNPNPIHQSIHHQSNLEQPLSYTVCMGWSRYDDLSLLPPYVPLDWTRMSFYFIYFIYLITTYILCLYPKLVVIIGRLVRCSFCLFVLSTFESFYHSTIPSFHHPHHNPLKVSPIPSKKRNRNPAIGTGSN